MTTRPFAVLPQGAFETASLVVAVGVGVEASVGLVGRTGRFGVESSVIGVFWPHPTSVIRMDASSRLARILFMVDSPFS